MKKVFAFVLVVIICLSVKGQVKISEMPTLSSNPTGAYLPVIRGGINYKVPIDNTGFSKVDTIITRHDSIIGKKYGQEFFISLGTRSDYAKLIFNYGFIVTGNPYDPLGTDITVTADTTGPDGLATKHEINVITNIDTVASDFIVSDIVNAPTGSETDGTKYLVGTSPTGDFAGHADDVAKLVGGIWTFTDPSNNDQLIVDNPDNYETLLYNGTAWVVTSKLVKWGGDIGLGGNAFIGRRDSANFYLRSFNQNFLYGDPHQNVYFPKYDYDSLAYYKPGPGGRVDTGHFTPDTHFDSLRNNSGVLEGRKNGVFVPQFTLPSGISSVAWGDITGTLSDQTDLQSALDAKEDVANKSTNTSLGTSNTLYPSQNAVKVYVDNALSLKLNISDTAAMLSPYERANHAAATYELLSNKSTNTSLGTSNTLYPSQNAVKTYVDNGLSLKLNISDTAAMLSPYERANHAAATYLAKASNLSDVANANTALNNLLPSQTGANGKVLQSNGTDASWQTPSSSVTVADSTITATAAQTAFNFSTVATPTATKNVFLSIDGIDINTTFWSRSSTTYTFTDGLQVGQLVRLRIVQ